MKEENLIFIISQPRSGSTYLQNLLSNNVETNTCSEPWILLNFANQLKPELLQATFDIRLTVNAYKHYQNKYSDFNFKENQKQFLLSLYEPMFKDYNFVIDKTPRYWEILDEIVVLFPKSKIIILKRNPINVLKSMIKTWGITSLEKMYDYKRDLLIAPKKMHSFCIEQENNTNVYSLKYEDLVSDTTNKIKNLYEWIGIEYDESILDTSMNQKYKGKYGDPYQNSNSDGANRLKDRQELKNKIENFEDFLNGYVNYFGSPFLKEYGNYNFDNKPCETVSFKYFMHLNRCNIKSDSFSKDLVNLLKKYYYKIRVSKHFY